MLTRRERTPLRKLMFLGAMAGAGALVEDTATGNPLTFITDVSKPLKSLIANFLPVQASGTPSLENILPITGWDAVNGFHAGANLIGCAIGATKSNNGIDYEILPDGGQSCKGTATSTSYGIEPPHGIKFHAGIYTMSVTGAVNGKVVIVKNNAYYREISGGDSSTFALAEGDSIHYYITFPTKTVADETIYVQFQVGSRATEYEPYKAPTVYPVTFPALGKNLCSLGTVTFTSYKIYEMNDMLPGGQYRFTCVATSQDTDTERCQVGFYNTKTQQFVSQILSFARNERAGVAISATGEFNAIACYAAQDYLSGEGDEATFADIQIETGVTATPYEPYTNTLYGGYYNLITGELWANWELWSVSEQTGWTMSGNEIYRVTPNLSATDGYAVQCVCESAVSMSREELYAHRNDSNIFAVAVNNNYLRVVARENGENIFATLDDWKAYIAENPLTVVYELFEPVLITTLTPEQITAINGDNTVWSDANGTMTVTFLKKK